MEAKINKKAVILSVAAVLGVFALVAAFLLFKGIRQFSVAKEKRKTSQETLKDYYLNNPFPSSGNLRILKDNNATIDGWIDILARELRDRQIKREDSGRTTSSSFITLLGEKKKALLDMADKSGTLIPDREKMAFGFDRYSASGVLPNLKDVPRLSQQLAIIEKICMLLYAERVKDISQIVREEFEGGSAPAGSRRSFRTRSGPSSAASAFDVSREWNRSDAGEIQKGEQFAKYRFIFSFSTKESAIISILNRLASSEVFIVVSCLEIEADHDSLLGQGGTTGPAASETAILFGRKKEAGLAPTGGGKKEKLSIRERLVCGPDIEKPARVRMEIEVYIFDESEKEKKGI